MLKLEKKIFDSIYAFKYCDYEISEQYLSIENIVIFLNFFELELHSESVRNKFGYLYDFDLTSIVITGENTCDITFFSKVMK